mmetsp:Transcript_65403/g.206649  ORF Transcript_65403/g.206649 Transcript_65403/m.206649 type:complete len:272 (+) Transcript_65403:766-1581(+)
MRLLPSSQISASASSIHGDSCPDASGDAMPELTTEASAEAIEDFTMAKSGVATPKPGVPDDLACAAEEPSLPPSFSRRPCSFMLSRWSCTISSTHSRPLGPLRGPPLRLPPTGLTGASALPRNGAPACSVGSSGGGRPPAPARGVGCGDTAGVDGGVGCRTCCRALIRSSCFIRQEFRPHRAHVSSTMRVAIETWTSWSGGPQRAAPQASSLCGRSGTASLRGSVSSRSSGKPAAGGRLGSPLEQSPRLVDSSPCQLPTTCPVEGYPERQA